MKYPDCPHCGRDDAGIVEHEGAESALMRCVWCLRQWRAGPIQVAWSREAERVELGMVVDG